jgi:hypothetical protein
MSTVIYIDTYYTPDDIKSSSSSSQPSVNTFQLLNVVKSWLSWPVKTFHEYNKSRRQSVDDIVGDVLA